MSCQISFERNIAFFILNLELPVPRSVHAISGTTFMNFLTGHFFKLVSSGHSLRSTLVTEFLGRLKACVDYNSKARTKIPCRYVKYVCKKKNYRDTL